MKIFILEDNPPGFGRLEGFEPIFRKHDVTIANSYYQGINKFKPPYDIMLLDHDLEDQGISGRRCGEEEPNTGYAFVKIVAHKVNDSCRCIVHSWNPDGAKNIASCLRDAGLNVEVIPYGPTLLKYLREIVGTK